MTDSRFYEHHGPVQLADISGELSCVDNDALRDVVIHSVSDLAGAGSAGDLTYIQSKAYVSLLDKTRAKYCLCVEKYKDAVIAAGLTPLVSTRPRGDFALILSKLFSRRSFGSGAAQIANSAKIDGSAILSPGVVIGEDVTVEERVYIGPNAVIAPGCVIGAHSHIGASVLVQCAILGEHVKINAGARIGGDGFGVTQIAAGQIDIPHIGRVVIGDHVTVGYNSTVDRGMLGDTVLGEGTKLDNLVQIGHNVQIGQNVVIAAHGGIAGSAKIGDNVQMGGRVGIADHITIGAGAQIAGAAAVMKDVPAGEIWSGYPAKPLRQHMREIAMTAKLTKPKKS